VHLQKLVSMEYLLIHRGGRGQSFVYELLYDGKGKDGKAFLMGLIEPGELDTTTNREHREGEWEHRNPGWEQSGSTEVGTGLAGGSSPEIIEKPSAEAVLLKKETNNSKKTHRGGNGKASSYPQPVVVPRPRGEA